jgi:hypothetical protein
MQHTTEMKIYRSGTEITEEELLITKLSVLRVSVVQ